ncbi:MAG: acyl-CoA dehydrogenase [Hyphomonadaceae bacterium]|nr:acyl-CoA dehydrogenase [Hyphomonadaceae bacterium]
MNFDDTPEEAALRAKVRAWIDANAPIHLNSALANAGFGVAPTGFDFSTEGRAWQKKKFDGGWACMQWPREYGGQASPPINQAIWQQEEGVYGALSRLFGIAHGIVGPTIIRHGSDEQKAKHLPRMANGQESWCQLFSEPAAGSDLAGLRTRAQREGANWLINGQKIWTSYAQYADFGMLITRTDPTVAKHRGLTMFLLDMRTPGVEVRPIKQANGQSGFNEVFFDDVRIPDSQRIGGVNDGWNVAMTMLMNERLAIGLGMSTGFEDIFALCCDLQTADGPAIDDPAITSRLATWAARSSGLKYTVFRSLSALSRGETPGPENSIGKLVAASTQQEIAMFALDLQAQSGALVDPAMAAASARFQAMLMRAPGMRIEGGTDEIQRNIIAERVLGLPSDIRVDKDVPFNEIPSSARR